MITRDIPIRVRYYETDCMGFVHHSNYVRYYETARTEMLRELGMTYPELEAQGIMLPVIDVQSRYVSPAFDDDLLTVRVTLAEMPKVKMRFDYEVFRENGERINTGSVTLAFMNAATRRACRENPGGPVDAAMVGSGFLFYPSDAVSTAYRPERPRMPVPPFACRRPVESGCRRL